MNAPWKFGSTKYTIVDAVGQQVVLLAATPDAERNGPLIAAAPELLDRLKVARAFIADQLEVLERSYLPEPNEAEVEELTETRCLLEGIEAAIAKAEGRQ